MRVETQACVSSMVLGNVIIIFYNSNPVKKELSSYFIGENRFAVINHLIQYLTALWNRAWKSNSKAQALSHHDTALKIPLFYTTHQNRDISKEEDMDGSGGVHELLVMQNSSGYVVSWKDSLEFSLNPQRLSHKIRKTIALNEFRK